MSHVDMDCTEQAYTAGNEDTTDHHDTMVLIETERADDTCCYVNAATCPDCGAGMVRLGTCFTCPLCGWGGCG